MGPCHYISESIGKSNDAFHGYLQKVWLEVESGALSTRNHHTLVIILGYVWFFSSLCKIQTRSFNNSLSVSIKMFSVADAEKFFLNVMAAFHSKQNESVLGQAPRNVLS